MKSNTTKTSEYVISDLSVALPSEALSTTPKPDRWMVIPYESEESSGKMLWCPVRSQPQDISVPLPDLGMCRIYIGIYGGSEPPTWIGAMFGRQNVDPQPWTRLYLRLSDEDWLDYIVPDNFPDEPQRRYISESLWKTAEVTGKSLVLAPPRKEAFIDTETSVAYIRLVPVETAESWPKETKRLVNYYDGNFEGHFVESISDVKTEIAPLKESDCEIVFWNTSREDSCYYPTKVGNTLSFHGMSGAYPHWMGRDVQRMLERGQDPLKAACEVAHENGIKIFGSYRRMTVRVAPHIFPLHPEALFVKRPDLRCVHRDGYTLSHLSLTHPEVRQRMIDILAEQAENYDIDGVHMFFCRGVPFVQFEQPFLDAFQDEYDIDPKSLELNDRRVWAIRARFFLKYMRDLRSTLTKTSDQKGRKIEIAMTVMNSLDSCAYFGMDIKTMIAEKLVDKLVLYPCAYLPPELGEYHILPEFVAEFCQLAKDTGVRIYVDCGYDHSGGKLSVEERVAEFYKAGADGIEVKQGYVRGYGEKRDDAVHRRLGRIQELDQAQMWRKEAARPVRIKTIAGFPLDTLSGLPTAG